MCGLADTMIQGFEPRRRRRRHFEATICEH